jgi:hypothetical protein
MSLTIIKRRERIEQVTYDRYFERVDLPGAGFGFDCREDGTLLPFKHQASADNYKACAMGEVNVIDRGVRVYRHSFSVPAEGRCACGRIVVLDGDTRGEGIDCECGRIYSSTGQELAPRSQWGEETGERFA